MKAQQILEGICRHRANPMQVNMPSGLAVASDVKRKLDEIEWALQAIAEYLVDIESRGK